MKRSLIVVTALLMLSCAAAKHTGSKDAYTETGKSYTLYAQGYAPDQDRTRNEAAPSMSTHGGGEVMFGGVQRPAPDPTVATPEVPEKKVVYTGHLSLRVKRLMEAVDEITRITQEKEGYVETLSGTLMIVRIPGDDFEAVMDALSAVGHLLDRRVEAMDVTAPYTDLIARLDIAKQARKRLQELLETTKDTKERIRIVEEITRLSDQIESIEATLASIENLVEYYTIYIQLTPVLDYASAQRHRSPFEWVRALTPHRSTIWDGRKDVEMVLPKSFVEFKDTDEYRAQASDTTVIRVGVLENEPNGDNEFWLDAIAFEMEARDEEVVEREEIDEISYSIYKTRDLRPSYYLVGVWVVEDEIYVVEVFFPKMASYAEHGKDVITALETMEVK